MKALLKPNVRLIPQGEAVRDAELRSRVVEMIVEAEQEKGRFALLKEWYRDPTVRNLYVIFDEDMERPVGLVGWSGPPDYAEPFWWVSPGSRRKGYGTYAVERLAEEMHRQGIKDIASIPINSESEAEARASEKLAHHLRKHFYKLKG
jgi:RimJ/RimL family protein N-acetyltransferase